MTLAPNDVIPPELMKPEAKDAVVKYVLAQPWPGAFKGRILKGWFKTLGVPVDPRALDEVEKSGP